MLDTNPTSNGVFDMFVPDPSNVPLIETTMAEFSTDIPVTKYVNEDESLDIWNGVTPKEDVLNEVVEKDVFVKVDRDSKFHEIGTHEEVTSENMWERTEVLAGEDSFFWVFFSLFLLLTVLHKWLLFLKKKVTGGA